MREIRAGAHNKQMRPFVPLTPGSPKPDDPTPRRTQPADGQVQSLHPTETRPGSGTTNHCSPHPQCRGRNWPCPSQPGQFTSYTCALFGHTISTHHHPSRSGAGSTGSRGISLQTCINNVNTRFHFILNGNFSSR